VSHSDSGPVVVSLGIPSGVIFLLFLMLMGEGGSLYREERIEVGVMEVLRRALLSAITFFKPCGVGILTQTWCAVISHTRKRGRDLG